jgi:hypothetical protein
LGILQAQTDLSQTFFYLALELVCLCLVSTLAQLLYHAVERCWYTARAAALSHEL